MKSLRVLLCAAFSCVALCVVIGCSEGGGAPEPPKNPTEAPAAMDLDQDKNAAVAPPLD